MNRTRFGLLDTIESIPLETKKRLKKKYNNNNNDDEQGGNDKKYVETTYSELKSLRDEGKLVPGALYRITDYQCTTSQEGTRSAGHQFDIIVQALSESVLSEDTRAIQHKFGMDDMPQSCWSLEDGEVCNLVGKEIINNISYAVYQYGDNKYYINPYALVFGEDYGDDEYYGYMYAFVPDYCDYGDGIIDGEGYLIFKEDLREFSYFSDSNLAAWKLKYCLDNDEERFAWAKNLYLSPISHNKCIQIYTEGNKYIYVRQPQLDNENGVVWVYNEDADDISIKQCLEGNFEHLDKNDRIYTQSEDVYIGQILVNGGDLVTVVDFSEQGKGVIYQMIDEYNNNCPYDFKNIQFLRDADWHSEHTDWSEEVIGEDPGRDIYYFTFSWINSDFSVEDVSVVGKNDGTGVLMHAENNIINVLSERGNNHLNNIILVSSYNTSNGFYYGTINNVFKYGCTNCTFGDRIRGNIFDTGFVDNIFSNIILRNESFGDVYNINQIGNIQKKIIYMDSDETIYFKDINDAFSGT